jgi:hypothetical protein
MVISKRRPVDQKKADAPSQYTLCKSSKWVLWLFRFLKKMRIVITVVFWGSAVVALPLSPRVFVMHKISKLDLSLGATIYCQRTGKRCEVVRHFAYSNIDHVVVAFDIIERTPRHITLSVRAAEERFVSSPAASVQNIYFLPKLLAG